MKKNLRIGVVGATGMVGQTFLFVLAEAQAPIEELRLFASENSQGKKLNCAGKDYPVHTLSLGCFDGLDVVFFSSGEDISLEWAPHAQQAGAWVIDNSSAYRMDPEKLLCIPEVNGNKLKSFTTPQIIANPNCSTIQLAVTLKPILDQFGLSDVKVATYQAVSGAGISAYEEILKQTSQINNYEEVKAQVLPDVIAYNLIPQIGSFDEQGFCTEEIKICRETRKILDLPKLPISAFTVRVPVLNAHSEAVWVTLPKTVNKQDFVSALEKAQGLTLIGASNQVPYPTPRQASGENGVFVGRIHQDSEQPQTWLMWIVADNLRKGAALNGWQIAARIFDIG